MRRPALAVVFLLSLAPAAPLAAQDRPARWERRTAPTEAPVTVFHSTQAANVPTAETLRAGEWLFEISHRFWPAIADGSDALWGFDGPVYNRLGLAWAATDRVMIGVLRTSLDDNLELNAKARLWEGGEDTRLMVGAMGGIAWNTELAQIDGAFDNERQAYLQLILNVGIGERIAVGVVPTWLHNPRVRDVGADNALSLGLNGQIYLSEQVSLLGEWIVSEEREGLEHDSGTFGVELETGGHFFKIVLTNQRRMNPTQFLGGTPLGFGTNQLRVGFNITRLLTF